MSPYAGASMLYWLAGEKNAPTRAIVCFHTFYQRERDGGENTEHHHGGCRLYYAPDGAGIECT